MESSILNTTETIIKEVGSETIESVLAPLASLANATTASTGGMMTETSESVPESGVEPDLYLKSLSKTVILKHFTFGREKNMCDYLESIPIVERLFTIKSQIKEVLKMWRYFRADLQFTFQANASVGVTGAIWCFFMPPGFQRNNAKWSKSTIFNWPGVWFNYGSTTTANLVIPYMSHRTFWHRYTDAADGPYIGFMVVAPFRFKDGMLNEVDITVMVTFKNLTMTCPLLDYQSPAGQAPPQVNEKSHFTKFKYTEPRRITMESDGVANLANGISTGLNISSGLAGERTYYTRNTVGGSKPIKDILEIAHIPSFPVDSNFAEPAGHHFSWSTTATIGSSLYKYSYTFKNLGNLGYIGQAFQAYSGTVNLHVTVCASSLHRGRLMVSVSQLLTANPVDEAIDALTRVQYGVLDLSAQSELIIPLPFMYDSWMYPLNDNEPTNALFRICCNVVNRLATSAAAASEVEVLLRFSAGKDFKFFYLDEPGMHVQAPSSWGSMMDLADPLITEEDHQRDMEHFTVDEPEEDLTTMMQGSHPTTLGAKLKQEKISPISYSSIRLIFGRAWLNSEERYNASDSIVHVTLRIPKGTHAYLMHYFCYWAGEVNVTITNDSENILSVIHSYSEIQGAPDSAGAIVIPSKRVATFTTPFYSLTPVRSLQDEGSPVFGHLYVHTGYLEGNFRVYLSLKNPNFFVPHPLHKKATARHVALEPDLHHPSVAEAMRVMEDAEDEDKPFTPIPPEPSYTTRMLMNYVKRQGWRKERILLDGDVESNPGPGMYKACYIHRGLYKHYGITDGKNVIHLNTEDILWSAITGKAKVQVTELDGRWIVEGPWTSIMRDIPLTEMDFSINSNCETFVRDLIRLEGMDQGDCLKIIFCIFLASLSTAMFDQDSQGAFMTIVSNVMTFTQNKIICRILKFVLRLVLYAVLFAHAPCIATGGSVAALICLDISNMREGVTEPWVDGFVKSAIQGDVGGLIESVAEALEDDDEKRDGFSRTVKEARDMVDQSPFDDFNKATLSFKNIEWWMDTLSTLVEKIKEKFSPSEKTKFLREVKKYGEPLASLFTTATAMREHSKTPLFRPDKDFEDKLKYTKELALHWHLGFQKFCPTAPLASMVAATHRILQGIELAPVKPYGMTRPEPLGVYICGEAGQGKSFLTTRIIKEVCDAMCWPKDSVYFHPTGSKFMDGYQGQEVHVIDDFGQTVAEEEYSLLCQMISTTQFSVPMARIEDKGAWYSSKLVIATSNRVDFSSTTLFSKEALERRFPIYVKMKANPAFCYGGVLQATKHIEKIKNATVWLDENNRELVVSNIVDKIVSQLLAREDTSTVWSAFINQAPLDDGDFDRWKGKLVMLAAEAEESMFGESMLLKPSQKFVIKTKEAFHKIDNKLKKYGHWMVFITTLSTIVGALAWWGWHKRNKTSEEEKNPETSTTATDEVYNGTPTAKPKKTLFSVAGHEQNVVDQSPLDEFSHLEKSLVRLVADRVQVFGLAIGSDQVLTYGHAKKTLFDAGEVYIVYGEHKILLKNPTFQPIEVDGKPTDLAIINTGCGLTFVNGLRQYTEELSREGAIIWNTKNGFYMQQVKDILPIGAKHTLNGTWTHDTLQYIASTSYGTCGGMVVCKINGMWKFVAMHMAGNGFVGRAVRIPPMNQGVYQPIPSLGLPPAHLNRKTKLQPSPLHGVWDVKKGPAALSKFDPRTEGDPMDQIREKNVGNTFKPQLARFLNAKNNVKDRLVQTLGVRKPLTLSLIHI